MDSLAPEMSGSRRRRVALDRDYFALERAHQYFLARDPVEREPARVAPFQLRRKPFSPRGIPHYLSRRKSFTDRVEHVEQHAVELNRALADHLAHQRRRPLILSPSRASEHDQIALRYRILSRPEHGQVMGVIPFHLLAKFKI